MFYSGYQYRFHFFQASVICQDCQITMCTFCSEVHVQEKENLLHEIISLQEIVPENTLIHKQVKDTFYHFL